MPNESLLTRLDGLRDTYTQQQKAAASLQAVLASVASAHGKAQKALRDFSAQDPAVDVTSAQEAFAQAGVKETAVDPLLPELRREVKRLATLTGALKDAASALRSEPADIVRLDKAITVLQGYRQPDIEQTLPELREELNLAQRTLGDEFGGRLRAGMAEIGMQIGGRAPRFELGRFELEANFAKRALVLRYGKDVVVPHASVTVEAAVRAYQAASKAIMGRNQDGKAWLAQFHEAYVRARRRLGATGPRVNIVECYLDMVLLRQGRAFASEPSKRTFTDYMRAQFIYDFAELTGRSRRQHEGQVVKAHSATKSQADSPTRSMWIVEGDTPYDGRYIADVEFVRE